MLRHWARRASSGCADCSCGVDEVALEEDGAGAVRARFERSVSWTPGAEGAPVYWPCWVEVAWAAWGTIRRDCKGTVRWVVTLAVGGAEGYHFDGRVCGDAVIATEVLWFWPFSKFDAAELFGRLCALEVISEMMW